ncbi:helix-turn-helix domain-containing protein [Anaerocolumna sp. AGMB13025]|uniref:AraC family transcriptional regulator n=1 Tax=Anaerocolumna sp. AGMB13025 TaxID=3039116 RepID=UPI00241E3997|nr:AraC family transcriptional regulator [Anaerocolumna sp. AGMB13025]WFR56282.1 helix-turn-helix domain-containing protein [Anaerocolumna sp. AGMB13025]
MKDFDKLGYLNDDFRIFHNIDDKKKEFDFHYHDFNKIMIFLRGNISYSIEGRNYLLKPYDIVLVNAGEIHKPSFLEESTYERVIIYVSPEFIRSYKEKDYDLNYCFERAKKEHSNVLRIHSMDKSKLYQVCLELEHSLHNNDFANELYQKILFLEFMIQLNRTAISNRINYQDSDMANTKLLEILDYINEHLIEDMTIDNLAAKFYLNRYYLMHFFKEGTGYTIGNYITEKRLLLAKSLVQKGSSITEACFESGFKNYSTFSRAFKKAFNTVPKNAPFID